ncbi:baseplate protein [Yersinia phage vB_YenM_P778]
MGYVKVTSHYDVAKYENTPTQFREKLIYQAILKAVCAEVQGIEDTLYQMYTQRSLETSSGQQLDNIGAWLGVARKPAQTDDSYRVDLRATIAVRRSNGTADKILQTLMGIYSSTTGQIFEHNALLTGGVVVRVNNTSEHAPTVVSVMKNMVAACIGSVVILRDTTPQGYAWTPVEMLADNDKLTDNNSSWFVSDGQQGFVVDTSESGLEGSLIGSLADQGVARGNLLLDARGTTDHTLGIQARGSTGRLTVEKGSLTGGDYGFFAEVSQIRFGNHKIEGEVE